MIGLDAATFDVIDPLVEAGDLPNIARILEAGTGAVTLRSTTHPLTPHAWATMVTGVNAGRHGIWDFIERDDSGYDLRVINGSYRRAPALWDRLGRVGRRVGLVNIPFVPAPQVEGFAIAGMDAAAREQGMTHPSGLFEAQGPLRRARARPSPVTKEGDADTDFVRRAAEQKVEATLWLAERFEPDLLWVVFMAADHIHHVAWPDWERRGRGARSQGRTGSSTRRSGGWSRPCGGNDIVLVSDHGGGSLKGVSTSTPGSRKRGTSPTPAGRRLGRRVGDKLFELRRHLPKQLRYRVKQRARGLREKMYERPQYSVVDWPRPGPSRTGTFGNIVVNVRGREAQGIVEPGDEYERVRDELAERALEIRDPDGQPIVAAVHRREDLFDGPELEKIPDLLVEFRDSPSGSARGT